jgi:hypothetical protein
MKKTIALKNENAVCPNCRPKVEKLYRYLKRLNFSYPGSKKNALTKYEEDLLAEKVEYEIETKKEEES